MSVEECGTKRKLHAEQLSIFHNFIRRQLIIHLHNLSVLKYESTNLQIFIYEDRK